MPGSRSPRPQAPAPPYQPPAPVRPHRPPPPQPNYPPPGHFPAAHRPSPPPRNDPGPAKRKGRPLLIACAIGGVLIVAAVVAVVVTVKLLPTRVLDVRRAEAGVREILTDPINGYGANDVSAVRCNNGADPVAHKGDSFTCEVQVNGHQRHVNVLFLDDEGTYAVDGPR